jgi:hypothetical protein
MYTSFQKQSCTVSHVAKFSTIWPGSPRQTNTELSFDATRGLKKLPTKVICRKAILQTMNVVPNLWSNLTFNESQL